MNAIKYGLTLFAFLLLLSCGGGKTASQMFEIQITEKNKGFRNGSDIVLQLKNKEGVEIKSVLYTIDGVEQKFTNGSLALNVERLGNKTLKASITHEEGESVVEKSLKVFAAKAPDVYTYEVLAEYPHDKTAYTQGLEFVGDTLYESTGRNGQSSLRKVDFKTGKVLKNIALDDIYFGEGLTILNNKIYQLTWQKGIGFVYDLNTLEKTGSFKYGQSKEGWGLCNDGEKLYKSDGSERVWRLNPETLIEEDYIELVTHKSMYKETNELEYVNGFIYANVYQKESMMIIDAKTGAIVGVINFGGLKNKVEQHQQLDVLNGIAYHKERETFFVTGKNWDKMFEVKIFKK
ncbi:glutaminyl-peptide cyclotransferase [Sediminicola luteus]|uniref:Glutamine cyclotransferase n=1 Tax=Sediminicola luteus TaxID=319238 RepID=A0A2A4G5J6_9FLAO|nr:glutaminyl-peptide cyclotransferase [Sediminicola luteus]PCE63693.1 glutamine cyclotransferase [Sediminicola luteus]